MSYNTSKFPSDVSKLFRPRPPLQYKRPADYPPEKRCTNPNISGISQLLGLNLNDYLSKYPEGSENEHLHEYEKATNHKITQQRSLENKLASWEPHNDPNIRETDPYRTIFVGRLPYEISEIELQKEFSKFGEIERVRVVKNKLTNKSKGYAFVVFKNPQSSKAACREIGVHRGIMIGGRTCIVDIERGRTVKYFKPRRLGGGLGGRGYTKKDKMIESHVTTIDKPFRGPSMDHNYTRNQPIKAFPPRPVYSGPSRFSRSQAPMNAAPSLSSDIHDIKSSHDIPSRKITYLSRNARAQESRKIEKDDAPDY